MKRTWYAFRNEAADSTVARIDIIDFIGGWVDDWIDRVYGDEAGVTARKFVEQLAALPESVNAIHVHINSPGGDVQAGVNIANALREQASKGRTVETFVDGIAASIASVIAMAGSKVHMADNGVFMIHDPFMVEIGNSRAMRKAAEVLDTIKGQLVSTYQWHSPLDDEAIAALMAEETWMNAAEAKERGFVTDVVEGLEVAASIHPGAMNRLKVPAQYRARIAAFVAKPERPAPAPEPAAHADVMRLCNAAGLDLAFAQGLVDANLPVGEIEARVTREKTERAAEAARRTTIRGACTLARLPMLADGYIAGGMSADAVKAQLVTMRGLVDMVEIDTSLAEPMEPHGGPVSVQAGWKRAFSRVKGEHRPGGQA